MKLLAKTAEERYQTAAGAESDLRRCLAEWETQRRIDEFPLAEYDTPDRLLIPEKLYGREREIGDLHGSFDRVVATGRPELVLVSGYSGIGKSSVVNELHKVLVPPHGLFASGKFDQYKRDIPYATLAKAFQSLIRPLLGKSEAELRNWREALDEALGPNGLLIVNLVPELKLIIGEQPPIPGLPPQDAQARFRLVFRRFIGVFARSEHPLVVFLDDLQWLDLATLDLLEDLLRQPDVQHLMLIGAYRDNEVNSSHPLMRKLEAIRQAGAMVQEIILAPLTCEDLGRLIADSLHCEAERVTPLAQLVHEKTGGNPFFAIQFISGLAEEGLLTFDHSHGRWSWNLSRIQAKGYTDNVVDLMVGKLNRLPVQTQQTLKEFACLGNSAEIITLSIVHGRVLHSQDAEEGLVGRSRDGEGGTSEEEVHSDLWEALRLEFIVRLEGSYKFVHDRVQEAAYSLIPEELRAETHLQIGRLLTAHTPPERREESIFEIVNQLNRGAVLMSARAEREQLAELNLTAGKRARASTAYTSALKYLSAGAALLESDRWEHRKELSFALELYRAECEFLTGRLAAAEERLTMLSSRAANTAERATVECLRIDLYTKLDQTDRAVGACLDYLRHLGIEWSPHPTEEEARREYERIWINLGSRAIEELIELPLMSDPVSLATLDVLTKVYPSALTDANLLSMAVCRAVNLSLERGHSDGSPAAYEFFGKIAGPRFGDYKAGFRFGQLGYELVEKRGLERFRARTYLWFAQFVVPWTKHVQSSRALFRQAFQAATKAGDITVAAYSFDNLNTNFLAAGDPLVEAQRQAETGLEFAERARFGHLIDIIATQLGLIRTLRGLTYKFGCFDDGQLSEVQLERHVAGNPVADDSVKYLRVVGRPSKEDESGDFEFVGAVTDITELKRAEEVLRQKEVSLRESQTELAHVSRVTTMGELAASIAHEVNQPLLGVVTNASASLRLLAGDSPDLLEAREAIRAIIRDGNRAADVVSRMRALFKKARPAKERLNINEAIAEVVVLTQGEARRNKVALRTELATNLPSVMGDRVQIQQVVMNLILNGIEAMNTVEDRQRDLVIRTQRNEGDEIRVSVQDSGIGFDPLSAERIFHAFHSTKPGGMGMGLTISRSIVESHGGRLWVTLNDGPGATFQFTL